MIVKDKSTGKEYLVTGFCIHKGRREDDFSVVDIETMQHKHINMDEVIIMDGRFPPNFSMFRHIWSNGNTSFLFSLDNGFTKDDFWEDYEDNVPYALQAYYDFLDGLTDLHGLPRMKHPEIPAPPEEHEPTEEERRLKRIEDELNSYLDE